MTKKKTAAKRKAPKKTCPHCKAEAPTRAQKCPKCERYFPLPTPAAPPPKAPETKQPGVVTSGELLDAMKQEYQKLLTASAAINEKLKHLEGLIGLYE